MTYAPENEFHMKLKKTQSCLIDDISQVSCHISPDFFKDLIISANPVHTDFNV